MTSGTVIDCSVCVCVSEGEGGEEGSVCVGMSVWVHTHTPLCVCIWFGGDGVVLQWHPHGIYGNDFLSPFHLQVTYFCLTSVLVYIYCLFVCLFVWDGFFAKYFWLME